VVSWFEQKAIAVLLTLLSLNVRGITLGPTPPAFVTPNVFKLLQDRFDVKLTGDDPQADLRVAMGG
jgi:hydroxylamine reductase